MLKPGANLAGKVALITGGAKRIGAGIARHLHAQGMNLVLHYRHSTAEAHALQAELQAARADSVLLIQSELAPINKLARLAHTAAEQWRRLDVLVNNASAFYPTQVGQVGEEEWDRLLDSNLKAPFFLAQAAAPYLAESEGCIVNLADIHGQRPLKGYSVYSIAKAGLIMLTQSLARELGPKVRVNAVAPGAILWPDHGMDDLARQRIISATALKRQGSPEDIAKAVLFLVRDADYTTGQILAVDGGRSLSTA
jgi:pteridine reductase